jgi:hypothetical protein
MPDLYGSMAIKGVVCFLSIRYYYIINFQTRLLLVPIEKIRWFERMFNFQT